MASPTSTVFLNLPLRRPITEIALFGTTFFLILAYLGLVLLNAFAFEVPWLVFQMFDVDDEHNLPTFYSGFILLFATVLLWSIWMEVSRLRWSWLILFLGFAFLAADEIAGFHDAINTAIDPVWAWFGLIMVAIAGLSLLPFMLSLPRSIAAGFAFAGALYVGGAMVLELINEPFDSDGLAYQLLVLVEEGFEMLGVVTFIAVLLHYRANHLNR